MSTTMQCERAQELIDAYVSRELDRDQADEVAAHVTGCGSCNAAVRRFTMLRDAARDLRQPAPNELSTRVRSALQDRSDTRRTHALRLWRGGALAASLLAAAAVVWAAVPKPPPPTLLADEVVAAHVRSLMADHLLDVESSDQHTVKPWFTGRVDFSTDVRDFNADGYPLVGGRLDYLNSRSVIALVYRRDKHVINAFTWPGEPVPAGVETRQGYHIVRWRDGEMNWCLVSDAGEPTLTKLRELIRSSR
jgi:anti-sigma factor RsiW